MAGAIAARAIAALALAGALLANGGPAAAATGAELIGVCAPAGGGPPAPSCYAYVHAIIDDANLIGPPLDKDIGHALGLACAPNDAPVDSIIAAVVPAVRADPTLQSHSAAIAVRLTLAKLYPCSPALLRRPAPAR